MSGVWGSFAWSKFLLLPAVAALAVACPRDSWPGLPPEVIETPEVRPLPDAVRDVGGEVRPSTCPPGTPCDDDDPCTFDDRCNLAGRCHGQPYVCEATDECTASQCLGDGECAEQVLPDRCFIQGTCLTAGEVNPASICTECIPTLSQSEWSADDANKCDDGNSCTDDHCSPAGECDSTPNDKPCVGGTCSDGVCVPACTPDCTDKPCSADNGCGQACGCPGGEQCIESECVQAASCLGFCNSYDPTPTGCFCDEACFDYDDCCPDVCDLCPKLLGCASCQPDCFGKECGGDGCEGSCGSCLPLQTCKNGKCKPARPQPSSDCPGPEEPIGNACGDLTFDGCCDHKGRLHYCQLGQLYCIDCSAFAPECGWDQEHDWYECGTDGWPGPDGFPSGCP